MNSYEKAHKKPRKGPSWIGLRPATLLKRDSNVVVFLWIFQNFWRTSILKNIFERLLLNRIWKRCWKYLCEWLKKDLAAQEVAFNFLKTFINILWNLHFIQYCYFLDLVGEIFSIQSCIFNITAQKNITCQK